MTAPLPAGHPVAIRHDDRPLLGIGLLILAMAIVPLPDGIAKHLAADYAIAQIVWGRFFFHFVLLAPLVIWRYGARALWPSRPIVHLLRGGCLVGANLLFVWALRTTPLADAIAIFFIAPMVVTMLSALVLKERVGPRRWTAVVLGFAGVCIIARPGGDVFQVGALLAIGAGIAYAVYAVLTRSLSTTSPPLVTLTYTAVLGAAALSFVVPFDWRPPAAIDWLLFLSLGLIAAIGHYVVILAYRHAQASLLAPYTYTEIIMATVIGFVGFGDFPDPWTWVGIAVIVSSGIYISIRERHARTGAA